MQCRAGQLLWVYKQLGSNLASDFDTTPTGKLQSKNIKQNLTNIFFDRISQPHHAWPYKEGVWT